MRDKQGKKKLISIQAFLEVALGHTANRNQRSIGGFFRRLFLPENHSETDFGKLPVAEKDNQILNRIHSLDTSRKSLNVTQVMKCRATHLTSFLRFK